MSEGGDQCYSGPNAEIIDDCSPLLVSEQSTERGSVGVAEELINCIEIGNREAGFTNDETFYLIRRPSTSESLGVVVFIHGIGSFHRCFDAVAIGLVGAGYTVLCYDLIGRGKSAFHSTGKFGPEQHVDQLISLLEHLKIEQAVHVIGHSMGGAVATLFSSQYPQKVQSIALICPAGLMDGIILMLGRFCCCLQRWMREQMDNRTAQERAWRADFCNSGDKYAALQEHMVKIMLQNYEENSQTFEALWQCILQFPLFGLEDDVQLLSKVEHLRVFVIWGDRDKTIPMQSNMPRWRRILESGVNREVQFKIMPNAGHSFFFEYPQETIETIIKFLK